MNYSALVTDYIKQYEPCEPIFFDDVKKYLIDECNKDGEEIDTLKLTNNLKVILNRLVKSNVIKAPYKGVYCIPKLSIWGEVNVSSREIIRYKYLEDKDGNIKGFISGAKLFNDLGLTTQVPNVTDIVTNECKNNNVYYNESLRTYIRKPKIEINNENYRYLQFIELVENRDKVNIEVDYDNRIIYEFIKDNELDFEKIIKYARLTNSKKVMNKLYEIAK